MAGEGTAPRFGFRRPAPKAAVPESPEALFGVLPRLPQKHGALWSHQADMLRNYHLEHRATADVALELGTGSGKTLVGMLIAEWRRRARAERVIYACPTRQLAIQAHAAARAQGIDAILLIGSNREWDQRDIAGYTTGERVAVTVYSHIFNTSPKLEVAGTVLFDDAHAAEQYVADAWAVTVPAGLNAYELLLDALAEDLGEAVVTRMLRGAATVGTPEVRLVPAAAIDRNLGAVDLALRTLSLDGPSEQERNAAFSYRMIQAQLRACLFLIAPHEVYIRPLIPPTFDHVEFTGPSQRVYLSATLGEAGELERSFGRTPIARIAAPAAWEQAGTGRRFIVFPDLAERAPTPPLAATQHAAPASVTAGAGDAVSDAAPQPPLGGVLGRLVRLRPKRLLLTPTTQGAADLADDLGIPVHERFVASNDAAVGAFVAAGAGTLLAANRYDGMDLPGEACRIEVLSGLPDALHLLDRFLITRLRTENLLIERVRTRIQQGAGRCTRGPQDWALVVVDGPDLFTYLCRAEVRVGLPPDLQAEIEFGLENSELPEHTLVQLATSALDRDELWQTQAEPALAELRAERTRTSAPGAAALAASAAHEIEACSAAWAGDWDAAARVATTVLGDLATPALRPYQALWAYLGAAWAQRAADSGATAAAGLAAQLLARARTAAEGTTWLREVSPLAAALRELEPVDEYAVATAAALTASATWFGSQAKFEKLTAPALTALAQPKAAPYEQALATLGELLGAAASKPTLSGRADSVWLWPELWITFEAKTEQSPDGPVSHDYIRQTNGHLRLAAADAQADVAPPGSVSVIVSPRRVVHPDGVATAEQHVYLTGPSTVLDVAIDAVDAWKRIRSAIVDGMDEDARRAAVAEAFDRHRVLPSQVRERLTQRPVHG